MAAKKNNKKDETALFNMLDNYDEHARHSSCREEAQIVLRLVRQVRDHLKANGDIWVGCSLAFRLEHAHTFLVLAESSIEHHDRGRRIN